MSKANQQRFALLGAFIPMFGIFGVRAAKEIGWIPSEGAAIAFAIAVGIFSVGGGIIAYRTTQAQVRRDLDEVQNAGRINR
jgi:hypothetical protein